jgi:hypothetical protein
MNEEGKSKDLDLEWENRVLCSDESCIGTIGPEGRCGECGRPYEGILPDRTEPAPTGESSGAGKEADASEKTPAVSRVNDDRLEDDSICDADEEWERRTLCPDESCIGVVGPDGRCTECGRSL